MWKCKCKWKPLSLLGSVEFSVEQYTETCETFQKKTLSLRLIGSGIGLESWKMKKP